MSNPLHWHETWPQGRGVVVQGIAYDARSCSCSARRRGHGGGTLHASDAADTARRLRRPDRQRAPGADCAGLCDFVFRRRAVPERDSRHFRFRPRSAAKCRGDPVARIRIADGVAVAVRAGCGPVWWASAGHWQHRAPSGQVRRIRAWHDPWPGLDALRRPCARLDPDYRRGFPGHHMGECAACGLRHRRCRPDARDCLWRPGRNYPRARHCQNISQASARLRHRRDHVRRRVLFPVRHADRGVADGILPDRPDRSVTARYKETQMTIRSLATSFSVIALCLIGAVPAGVAGEIAREQATPFEVAALQGSAPNFVGITNWFNSAPLSMASLRGKVVLVDFWTYGCVNCVNTLPHVTQLYAKYRDRGLVVVGVHTPEFPFERSAANVQAALKRHGITYPVAQDNDSQTWNAYGNQY